MCRYFVIFIAVNSNGVLISECLKYITTNNRQPTTIEITKFIENTIGKKQYILTSFVEMRNTDVNTFLGV